MIEWLRLPGDLIFIGFGVIPLLIAVGLTYRGITQAVDGLAAS